MKALSICCLLPGVLGLGLALQTQAPVFRSGTDLVQLDVSVLDKNRQPVRGLMQTDFTILEDGKPQKVAAFASVDLPDVVRPATKWMNDVSPDVASNELDNRRIFALVLDDALMPMDLWAVEATRKSALSFIDRMGPGDLATVIFTKDNRGAQDLTADRVRLRRAVETLDRLGNVAGFPPSQPPQGMLAGRDRPVPTGREIPCWYYTTSMQVVQRAAAYLAALPQRRKTLIYMSGGMTVDVGAGRIAGLLLPSDETARRECGSAVVNIMKDAFRDAQRGNVNIYGLDPMGLRTGASLGSTSGLTVEFLQTVSDNTGGHAIINTNDFEPGLTQIFRENSSYYLLGYQPTNVKADGTFRRLEVKVNRPDVEVRTRKNYYAPAPPKAKAPPPPPPGVAAISEIVPKTDLPIRIVLAPFKGDDDGKAAVTAVIGLQRPAQAERAVEEIELLVRAFTPEGDDRGADDQKVMLNIPPARRGDDVSRYDLLGQLSLAPGRYRIRASANDTTLGKIGSVYTDVDVPDFAKEPLSMSGVAVSVTPGSPAAPPEILNDLMPIVPTAVREFARFERVTSFLRIYQGGKAPVSPVTLTTRVVNSDDKNVIDQTETLAAERFGDERAADVRYILPVNQLTEGEYLLTFESTLGKTIIRRDVRFSVK